MGKLSRSENTGILSDRLQASGLLNGPNISFAPSPSEKHNFLKDFLYNVTLDIP